MGYDIRFRSTERISPKLQAEIIELAKQAFSTKSWVQLTCPELENDDGTLGASTRMTVSPHPDDVVEARTNGQPDGRLLDLLGCVCLLSRTFDVDWEFAHDYGELGFVRGGVADEELRQFCDGFNEMFDGTAGDLDPGNLDDE